MSAKRVPSASASLPIRGARLIATFASILCRAILVLMVVHIVIDIVFRYVLQIALPGTIAFVSNYYMISIIFLPLATAEIDNRHIDVEVLEQRLPAGCRAFLKLAAWLVTAAVFALLVRETWSDAMRAYHKGLFIIQQGYRIPIWMSNFMLPLGFAAVLLVHLTRIGVVVANLPQGLKSAVATAADCFGKGARDV